MPRLGPSLLVILPVAFVTVLIVSASMVALGKSSGRKQLAKLRDARRHGSFATFAADFPPDFGAPEILRAVYDAFQRAAAAHQDVDGLVVRADDALDAVYDARPVDEWNDLMDLDLREVVEEAARACGRRLPAESEITTRVRLRTVREVVHFLERCPLATAPAADAAVDERPSV